MRFNYRETVRGADRAKVQGSRFKVRAALVNFFAVVGGSMVIYGVMAALFGESAVPAASAQQDQFLARRIDQVEQRFYSIESRINRLEQQARPPAITPRITGNNDTEIEFLRTQVASLRTRLGEAECGLLRVDERTLTAAARSARRKGGESEKCRVSTSAPVELSVRP